MSDYRDLWNPGSGNKSSESDYDSIDLDFYGKSFDEWNVVEGTPARGAGRDGSVPGKPGRDPLADLDDAERDAFVRLRRWGKGPIFAAAEELGYKDINDVETMDEVYDWLVENYGDLFDDGEEEEEREPFVPTPYERKELDMGDFKLPDEMKIKKSGITVQNQPMKINKKPITGMNYGT